MIVVNLGIPFIWKKLSLKIYLFGSLIWGSGILIISFSYVIPVYFVGVLVTAMGLPIASLSRVYLLQENLPTDKLGRGFSFNAVLLYLSNAISLGVFGFLSAILTTRILFLLCGFMMIFFSAVYFILISKSTRRHAI